MAPDGIRPPVLDHGRVAASAASRTSNLRQTSADEIADPQGSVSLLIKVGNGVLEYCSWITGRASLHP